MKKNMFFTSYTLFIFLLIFSVGTKVNATAVPTSGSFDCTYSLNYDNPMGTPVEVRLSGDSTSSVINFDWTDENCDPIAFQCQYDFITSALDSNSQAATYAMLRYTKLTVEDFVGSDGNWTCPTIKYDIYMGNIGDDIIGWNADFGNSSSSYRSSATATANNCVAGNGGHVNTTSCVYSIRGARYTGRVTNNKIKFFLDDIEGNELDYTGSGCPDKSSLYLCMSETNSDWYFSFGECNSGYANFNAEEVSDPDGIDNEDGSNPTSSNNVSYAEESRADCEGTFGDALDLFAKYFNWIKIGACVLLLVLGSLDFAQAVMSSDNDLLKKATNKFMKRCIAVLLIFFVPVIVNMLLHLPGVPAIESVLCGIS